MFLLAYGLANGRPNKEVQLHSTTLTLTLNTLKLKDAVATTVQIKKIRKRICSRFRKSDDSEHHIAKFDCRLENYRATTSLILRCSR